MDPQNTATEPRESPQEARGRRVVALVEAYLADATEAEERWLEHQIGRGFHAREMRIRERAA